jgi:hypothetical protein
MQIYQVNLTKQKLAAMHQLERTLLLLLGHARNEINVLSKLILMAGNSRLPPHQIVDHVEAAQILIIMQVLIGKLHEAWELFKRRVQSNSHFSSKYLLKLSPKGAAAHEELNRRFRKGSVLTKIRNKISFYYRDEDNLIDDSFQRLADTEPWEFYLSKTRGNTFYYASELVITKSAIQLVNNQVGIEASDLHNQAFKGLCDIVIRVSDQIGTLFDECIAVMVTEAMEGVAEPTAVDIGEVPKRLSASLPFFFNEEDLSAGS